MPTTNGNTVTEEEIKVADTRFQELNKKEDRTTEENTELQGLKDNHHSRSEKRIGELTWKTKTAEERGNALETENADLKAKLAEKDNAVDTTPKIIDETIKVGDKTFYTDEALNSMITAGKINQAEGSKHYNERIAAVAGESAYQRIKNEDKENSFNNTRTTDMQKVLTEHPEFAKNHPNHDPNDPVFKLANELFQEGLGSKADGLSRSVERAKQILGKQTVKKPDMSDTLNVDLSRPGVPSTKSEQITLSDDEQEAAVRLYCMGDAPKNPKTNKAYTQKEAINKALGAKRKRIEHFKR